MYLKDSDGSKSLTATCAIIAFVVVLIKFLFSGAEISLSGFSYSFGFIGSDEIAALLGTTLGTYSIRRYTDRKFPSRRDTVEP